jgi:hypothetical protein
MMKVPAASAATLKLYDALVESLSQKGAEGGAMFGMPSIKIGGKGFCGLFGDAIVVKLEGAMHTEALGLRGATLFDPSGMGRAMKEWVVVPRAHAKRWPELAEAALTYVSSATSKKPAPKKRAEEKTAATKKRTKTRR